MEVVIGSDRCHQLDDPWSDAAVPLHFEQPKDAAARLVEAFGERPVQGVLALGDRPTATAALTAQALGLAYNSPEAVENCRSKLRQREMLRAKGVPVPAFFSFALAENLQMVLARVSFPCVVKPLHLSASQGVIRANNANEFRAAVERITRLLASPEVQVTRAAELDRLLVEEYIPGAEIALEGVLERGELRILALFDKPDPLEGPYFEETIYVTPSRLAAESAVAHLRLREARGAGSGPHRGAGACGVSRERKGALGYRGCAAAYRRDVCAGVAIWPRKNVSGGVAGARTPWACPVQICRAKRWRRA